MLILICLERNRDPDMLGDEWGSSSVGRRMGILTCWERKGVSDMLEEEWGSSIVGRELGS